MNRYIIMIMSEEEFRITSNVQIYENDCFVFENETYFVYNREGNRLYVKQVNKTVNVFQ